MFQFGKLPHKVQQSGQRKFGQRLGVHTGGGGDLDLAGPVPIGLGSRPNACLCGLDPAKVRAVFAPFLGFAPVEVKRDLGLGKDAFAIRRVVPGSAHAHCPHGRSRTAGLAAVPVDRRLRPRELRWPACPPALLANTNRSTTVDAHSPRLDVFCYPVGATSHQSDSWPVVTKTTRTKSPCIAKNTVPGWIWWAHDFPRRRPKAPAEAPVPRHHQLIVSLFGLYARRHGGALQVAAIISLMRDIGVESAGTRSSISRLKKRGIIDSVQVNNRNGYALAPSVIETFIEGDERIFHPRRANKQDQWLLATFTVPESQRNIRHMIRSSLVRMGFGSVTPGAVDRSGASA